MLESERVLLSLLAVLGPSSTPAVSRLVDVQPNLNPSPIVRSVEEMGFSPGQETTLLAEAEKLKTPKEAIGEVWSGAIPLWMEIDGGSGNLLMGALQVMTIDDKTGTWPPESDIYVGWIHVLDGGGFKGLIFVHTNKLEDLRKDEGRKTISIFNDNAHGKPLLRVVLGNSYTYNKDRFNDPDDSAVKAVAKSTRTVVLVTCDPPGCTDDCTRRSVSYGYASVPR